MFNRVRLRELLTLVVLLMIVAAAAQAQPAPTVAALRPPAGIPPPAGAGITGMRAQGPERSSDSQGATAKWIPAGYTGSPFGDSRNQRAPQRIPGRIQGELFDAGGAGVAYADSDGKNSGSGALNPIDGSYLNGFRADEAVDTSYTKDRGTPTQDFSEYNRVTPDRDALYLGWTEPGEWSKSSWATSISTTWNSGANSARPTLRGTHEPHR